MSSTTSGLITIADAKSSSSSSSTSSTTSSSSGNSLSFSDFMNLMIEEIKNQDPSSPMSTSDMANQMVQMESALEMQTMTTAITTLTTTEQKISGTAMLGKEVAYTNSSGSTVTGQVQAVVISGSDVYLDLDNSIEINFSDVTAITSGSSA
jgi:flagellar basal-body rod modification protein FlgD